MSNHLSRMLAAWQGSGDRACWVLGTVFRTEGSAYRKAGAMMMISDSGQLHGILSGGCLEADIARNARKVMHTGKAIQLVYDGNDEDDLSFRLGMGCGGAVHVMLQPVTPENDLGLGALYRALATRRCGYFYQKISSGGGAGFFREDAGVSTQSARLETTAGENWLVTPVRPEPHILIVGGGMDAQPLVRLASAMEWRITLMDPRPANARPENFTMADTIMSCLDDRLIEYVKNTRVDAAILMTHNMELDAKALCLLAQAGPAVSHVSVLGPRHRFDAVLKRAQIRENALPFAIDGPAGVPIGGDMPESIALSMMAGVHRALYTPDVIGFMSEAAE